MVTTIRTHPWTMMTFRFENEFNAHTMKRVRSLPGRLFAGCVILKVKTVNKIEVKLLLIETLPEWRFLGKATEAMKWLCEMADGHDIQISLCPVQLEDDSMSCMQLTRWYQKFGFVRLGFDFEMVRYPSEKCQRCGCKIIEGICQNYGCEHEDGRRTTDLGASPAIPRNRKAHGTKGCHST